MNKLRRSTYLCAPSGNRKQGKSLVCAQFVHSTHFFLTPQKGAVKNYRFELPQIVQTVQKELLW